MKKRIWELDALRGLCILGMVGIHLIYDLSCLRGWQPGKLFLFCKQWGGVLFFLLSGVCATLGRHPIRRGLSVLGCGMLCTVATWAVWMLGFAGPGIVIYFGTLHCLGTCMLLWPLLRRLPPALLFPAALLLTAVGIGLLRQPVPGSVWLIPLGFLPPDLVTSDFFPLLPFLGIFLLGACLGSRLYAGGVSLLSFPDSRSVRFLCLCGRKALPVYLLHQPVLTVILFLIADFIPV